MAAKQKKTMLLDPKLLDEARQFLGARTETETVMRLLESAVRKKRLIEGVRAAARLGPFDPSRI